MVKVSKDLRISQRPVIEAVGTATDMSRFIRRVFSTTNLFYFCYFCIDLSIYIQSGWGVIWVRIPRGARQGEEVGPHPHY